MSTALPTLRYDWKTLAVACVFHGSAIITTVFRLVYRWYTARVWWEDAWAAIALAFDITCIVGLWAEALNLDNPSFLMVMIWLILITSTCVSWAARISIMYSIVRVTDPQDVLRRIVNGIIACFAIMWIALIIQKVLLCEYNGCNMRYQVAIAHLVTDTISDLMLVTTLTYLLRDAKLTHRQWIVVISAFYASVLITPIATPLCVLLFVDSAADAMLIFVHVKPATLLMITNLLVIVSFMYRFFRDSGTDQPVAEFGTEFTTVIDLSQLTVDRSRGMTSQT